MDYKKIIDELYHELKDDFNNGKVADYIPELAKINPDFFGVHIFDIDGTNYGTGDNKIKFSIQSISKVLSLTLALSLKGDTIWERVGVEPSGSSFNSLVQLEYENGIPRNPLINSGALVISDILVGLLENPREEYLDFVRKIAQNEKINYNYEVAESERETSFRNAALINLMKSFGNIQNDILKVLDFYYHLCSIEMTCEELAKTFLLFANHGKIFGSSEEIISVSKTKRINAIMQTCGFYDEAGEFSFKVGLPGKSGVGGGIVAIYPNKYSIAVWSPRLNKKGNSIKGMKMLELLTTKSGMSIF